MKTGDGPSHRPFRYANTPAVSRSGDDLFDVGVLQLERLGDGFVDDLAVVDVQPVAQVHIGRQPLSASASAKDSVALLSAKVEVRATAPGMLATQ